MAPLLKIKADRGGAAAGVTLVNAAAVTGYEFMLDGADWGAFDRQWTLSTSQLGTGVAAGATQDPNVVKLEIHSVGPTQAQLRSQVSVLQKEADACCRSGGWLTWQANLATYPSYLRIMAADYKVAQDGFQHEVKNRGIGVLGARCEPGVYGDKMSFTEDFGPRGDGASSLADFTVDTGGGTLSVGVDNGVRPRGALIPSSTAQKRIRHTARGYTYMEAAVTMAIKTGASVAAADFSVGIFDAAGNGLVARIQGAATNLVQVATMAAGVPTSVASTAFTPAANTYYWLRFRREAGVCYAQVFTTPPGLMSVAAFETSFPLTITQQQANPGAQPGARMVPTATDEKYLGFDVRTYAYLYNHPDTMRLTGIPGDLPCFAEIEFVQPAAVSTQLLWGMCAWDERSRDPNLCWNGGGQDNAFITGTVGWSTSLASWAVNAGGTITRDTSQARYGNSSLKIDETVTSGTGAAFRFNRRFKRNRSYAVLAWGKATAGVVGQQVLAGFSLADFLTIAWTPSATFQFLSGIWTPTADREVADVAFRNSAATAQTVYVDGVQLYETSPVMLSAAIASTGATTCTITAPPSEGWEWYKARLAGGQVVALIDTELVRIDAIDATTGTLTLARGYDGTTAATHLINAPVYLIDLYTPHLDGVHFAGGLDVAGAGSPWFSTPATSTPNVADAFTRSGFHVESTTAVTSQQWTYLLDPATVCPGEFEGDRMLVEVWARFAYDASIPGLRIALSTGGDDSVNNGSYDLENGTTGLSHTTGVAVWRYAKIGVLSIKYQDIQQRRRQQISIAASWTATGFKFYLDYIELVRPGKRIMLPTGIDSSSRYPALMSTASAQITRRIYSDVTSEAIGVNSQYGEHQAAGTGSPVGGFLGGQAIILPTPNVDVAFKPSIQIPNAPTAPTAVEAYHSQQFAVAINPIPRYRTIR